MLFDCVHATAGTRPSRVTCGLGLHDGNPHVAECKRCGQRSLSDCLSAESATTSTAIATPPVSTRRAILAPHELQLAKDRAGICDGCEHNRGLTTERNGWPVYTVRCRLCGCGGLNLLRGRCKANKWPEITLEQTTGGSEEHSSTDDDKRQRLRLQCHLSPGDIVMLTAALRDLHRAHPGQYLTDVDTTGSELWAHNPHVTSFNGNSQNARSIKMHYPLIDRSNQLPVHFLNGYQQHLEKELGVRIPITEFRGDIHLSEEEKGWVSQVEDTFGYKGRFWIMVAGGKNDFTAKWWSPDFYQQVVDHFMGRIQFVQCGEQSHWHPPLKGAFNLIGKTNIRQFIRLMYHAEGVVCPVTFAMHLAAAVPTKTNRLRPCVVIAGGREPPHWEAYPGHQFLHTIGALPCCATGGCWRSRCQKIGDGDPKDTQNLCDRPVQVTPEVRIPQCMAMIKPKHVIEAIERYLVY